MYKGRDFALCTSSLFPAMSLTPRKVLGMEQVLVVDTKRCASQDPCKWGICYLTAGVWSAEGLQLSAASGSASRVESCLSQSHMHPEANHLKALSSPHTGHPDRQCLTPSERASGSRKVPPLFQHRPLCSVLKNRGTGTSKELTGKQT